MLTVKVIERAMAKILKSNLSSSSYNPIDSCTLYGHPKLHDQAVDAVVGRALRLKQYVCTDC